MEYIRLEDNSFITEERESYVICLKSTLTYLVAR